MIRTSLKPSSKPMARTPMKRGTSRMKSRGPKMTPIRKSAKGEECTLRFACCNWRTDTTVWAHSNHSIDGKGMGIKARDEEGAYSCYPCHLWLDGGYVGHASREEIDVVFDRARAASQAILKKKGLMK